MILGINFIVFILRLQKIVMENCLSSFVGNGYHQLYPRRIPKNQKAAAGMGTINWRHFILLLCSVLYIYLCWRKVNSFLLTVLLLTSFLIVRLPYLPQLMASSW